MKRILCSILLFIIGLIIPIKLLKVIIYLISYLIISYDTIIDAIKGIIKKELFDESFLMSIATIGAFIIGEYPEAIWVIIFYKIGEMLEDYATDNSKKSIEHLIDITPQYANLLKNNEVLKVDPKEILIDDIIIVKPYEKVPLDGIVIEGTSYLDTKAITGESTKKSIKENDEIYSGFINLDNTIKVKVTKTYSNSAVNKILKLVNEAENKKAKSENFITKFAKIYTPIVCLIALLIIIIPSIFKPELFIENLYRSLSFLVISCPCALIISIPLSFFNGIGVASKNGILVKGSSYLESLSNIKDYAFDKTGTLTKGDFKVLKYTNEATLKYASYAEYYSNHPIALSIKEEYSKKIIASKIINTKEIPGMGIESNALDKVILCGNSRLMNKYNIDYVEEQDIGTIIYVAVDKKFVGSIIISDEIKEYANELISKLDNTYLLSGDKEENVKEIANTLHINKYYGNLSPEEKYYKLEDIKKEKLVCYVGDGINDAPVLTLADVGISMGKIGSDAAIEASDIVILNDNLNSISKVIKIAKTTMKIVKENIFISIFLKIIILLLNLLGIGNMWLSMFADVGVMLIVILNSIRISKIK